jgi:hypothetical protein
MIVPFCQNKRNHHRFFIHEAAKETVQKGSAQQYTLRLSKSGVVGLRNSFLLTYFMYAARKLTARPPTQLLKAFGYTSLSLSPRVKGKIVSITGKIPATPCGDREKRVLKCVA